MLDLQAYLNRLASGEPTPGGGSAATIVGALGAALVAMVARITLAAKQHADVHADAVMLVGDADALRATFLAARSVDENAYAAVPRAQALPRATDEQRSARSERLTAALTGAAAAPLHVAELSAQLLTLCGRAARLRNTHLMSDVACAIAFGRAALSASAASVRINHRFLKDAAVVAAQNAQLSAAAAIGEGAADAAEALVRGG